MKVKIWGQNLKSKFEGQNLVVQICQMGVSYGREIRTLKF